MATVQGVQGPIEAEQLGLTLIHEHFFSSDEAVTAQWPHVRDRETEHRLAVESAEADLAGPDQGGTRFRPDPVRTGQRNACKSIGRIRGPIRLSLPLADRRAFPKLPRAG